MLQLNHISKHFGDKIILNDINYVFEEGNVYPVLAGKGAGKTTLLKCISGEYVPDSGSARLRAKQLVYYIAEDMELPKYITGRDFIKYLCSLRKGARKPDNYLDRVNMDRKLRSQLIKDYTYEDLMRLHLAIVMVQKPYAVLVDDMLDKCSDEFIEELHGMITQEIGRRLVIITTGSLEIAKFLAKDILMLNKGELNCVSGAMINAPEIKQAIEDILGADTYDNY